MFITKLQRWRTRQGEVKQGKRMQEREGEAKREEGNGGWKLKVEGKKGA
jgi:hypothetical protein